MIGVDRDPPLVDVRGGLGDALAEVHMRVLATTSSSTGA
jgi:hypothetical protein